MINGEGSIHHGKYLHLIRLASKYPTVLVNCVYQENPEMPELKNLLYIAARESLSAKEIRNQGVNCEVVPDVMFASSMLRAFPKPMATVRWELQIMLLRSRRGGLRGLRIDWASSRQMGVSICSCHHSEIFKMDVLPSKVVYWTLPRCSCCFSSGNTFFLVGLKHLEDAWTHGGHGCCTFALSLFHGGQRKCAGRV